VLESPSLLTGERLQAGRQGQGRLDRRGRRSSRSRGDACAELRGRDRRVRTAKLVVR
jgi:hypothetical protein